MAHKVSCRLIGEEGIDVQAVGKTDEALATVAFMAMGRWSEREDRGGVGVGAGGGRGNSGEPLRVKRQTSGGWGGSGEGSEEGDESQFLAVAPRSGVVYYLEEALEVSPLQKRGSAQIARKGHAYQPAAGTLVGPHIYILSYMCIYML